MAKQVPAALVVLRRPQVEARVGLRKSSIYAMVAEGTFPAPIPIGARAVGWLAHEIDDWLRQRVAASRGG